MRRDEFDRHVARLRRLAQQPICDCDESVRPGGFRRAGWLQYPLDVTRAAGLAHLVLATECCICGRLAKGQDPQRPRHRVMADVRPPP